MQVRDFKTNPELIYGGIYIDIDGFAITLINVWEHSNNGFKVVEEYYKKDVSLTEIGNVLEVYMKRNICKYFINKPFNKSLINCLVTIDDIDLNIFTGLVNVTSMINDKKLKFNDNLEIKKVLKNYEKDTVNHRFFSLILAMEGITKNIRVLNFLEAMIKMGMKNNPLKIYLDEDYHPIIL